MMEERVGSPVPFKITCSLGDPERAPANEGDVWLTEEAMKDIQRWIEAAAGDVAVIAQISKWCLNQFFRSCSCLLLIENH